MSAGDAVGFETGVSRVGWALTVGFGLLAVLPLALVGPAGAVGVAGFFGLLTGLRRESEGAVGIGAAVLLAGVLLAGVYGLTPEPMLVAAAGALLTYDAAENALSAGAQLGRTAPTAGLELVHAAGTTLVLSVGGGLAYLVFRLVGGGKPMFALVLLLVGAVTLSVALR